MKKRLVLLPFAFVGGLITFLGGLVGGVSLSVLLIRSFLAVIVCTAVLLGLGYLLSKTLFEGTRFLADTRGSYSFGKTGYKSGATREPETESANPTSAFAVDAGTSSGGLEALNAPDSSTYYDGREVPSAESRPVEAGKQHEAGSWVESIDKKDKFRTGLESQTAEGQLRNADTRELANLVRHSINKDL